MAKKHLLYATEILLDRYDKAQKLYENAAEIFTSEMVTPEEMEKFKALKNELDSSLSTISKLLAEAVLHPNQFLDQIKRVRKMSTEFSVLEEDTSFSIEVRNNYHAMHRNHQRLLKAMVNIENLRRYPKSKKRQKRDFGCQMQEVVDMTCGRMLSAVFIDSTLKKLEEFVKGE